MATPISVTFGTRLEFKNWIFFQLDITLEMKENVQKGGIQISGDPGIKIKSLGSTYSQSLIFIRKEDFRR